MVTMGLVSKFCYGVDVVHNPWSQWGCAAVVLESTLPSLVFAVVWVWCIILGNSGGAQH